MTTCVLELDLDCNVRYVSHSWMELVGIARKEMVGTNIGTHISGDETDQSVFQRATEQMMKDSSSCRVRFCVCARVTDEQDSDSSEDDDKHQKRSHAANKTDNEADTTSSKPCGKCHKCGTASASTDKSADTSISSIESSESAESADFDTTVIRHSIDNLSLASSSHSTYSQPCLNELCVELEGQGVVMKGRGSEPSYTMWILKPHRQMEPLSIDIPLSLFETLGFGADVFVQYLETLQQDGVTEFSNLPPPPMAMCRICERQVPTWAFESHSQLCLIEHKAESHLQQTHENLSDHREAVAALLYYSHGTSSNSNSNSSSSLASPVASGASSPSPPPPALYRGLPIALTPGEEHIPGVSSSASSSPPRSPRQTAASLVLTKKRLFQKPTPKTPTRQIQLLLELCDTALDINGPESAVHSPNTAAKIHTVQEWPSASFRKNVVDPGLKLLYEDTERLCQEKVEATMRLSNIVTYFGKIKEEVDTAVHQVLEETLYQLRLQQDANDGVEAPAEGHKNDLGINESAITSSSDLAVGDVGISTPANSVAGTEFESGGPTALGSKSDISVADHNPSSSSLFSSHYLGTDSLPHLPAPTFSQSPQGSPNLSDSFDGMPPPPLPSSSQSEKNVTVQIGTPAPKTPSTPHVPALSLSSSHSDLRSGTSLSSDNILAVSPTKKSTTMTPRSFLADDLAAAKPPTPSPQISRRPSHISRQNINRPITTLNTNLPEFSMSDLSLSDGENRPRATSSAGGRSSNLGSPMAAPISGGNGPQRSRVHSINVEWTPLSSPLLFPYEPQMDDGIAPTPPVPVKPTQPSIKDYEIIKPISKGAFGSVYLSKKKVTGEYFAIKTLKKADMIAKNQVMNVKAERAILMAQQDSPFVAKLFFTFQNRDYLFLVMEYLSGGDCAALIKMLGGLPSDWITKYMAEVVSGVEDLHGRGIVHRDLKPDNLLLDSEGHIKLTDFGLSRMGYVGRYTKPDAPGGAESGATTESGARGSVSSSDSRRSSNFDTIDMEHSYSLVPGYFDVGDSEDDRSRSVGSGSIRDLRERSTSRGAHAIGPTSMSQPPIRQDSLPMSNMPLHDSNRKFVGTPDYLAPETIDGVGQDETSDWWSVGCIMFEFIYGYPPFHASTPEQVFDNILNRRIQWPSESEDEDDIHIDDNTRDLMMRLLEPTPSRRLGYNGAAEIKKHSFFHHVTDWNAVYQEEASFVPMAQSPENTDYFDSRGAQMEELSVDENVDESVDSEDTDRDSVSSPSEFPKIVSSARSDSSSPSQVTSSSGVRRVSSTGSGGNGGGGSANSASNSTTRKVPLHIPPHVRERRSRRLSETSDDFGNFSFKNLPVLDKANKDIINRLKAETLPIPVPRKESATSATGSSEDGSPGTGLGLSSSPATSATTSGSAQFINKLSASGLSPSPRGLGLQRRLSTLSSDSPDSPILAPPKMRRQPSAASAASAASESSPYNSDDDRERARLRVQKRRQMSRRFSSISLTTESPSFRPLYVLVCDPNPVWRYSISHILKELNCHIATVKTGSEAIRRGTSDTRFDCILTEYNLPKVNGEDVAKLIHSTNNANTSTPIVAVTSYLKAASETALFSAVIEKPVRRDVLSETLQRFCNWKEPDE